MCVVESDNGKLLIVISRDKNEVIWAFNSTTGKLKWRALKKIPSGTFQTWGVSGDGNDRLYVADFTNNCIQLISVSDGQYLGFFMKRGDQGLGYPFALGWSEATLSLVVGHQDGRDWFISDIH